MAKTYYRGQAKNFSGNIDNGNDIIPSILVENKSDFSIIDESKYYKECANSLKEVLNTVIGKDAEINIKTLGILQHYGIKTRLIDITDSPDIAMYFACSDFYDQDGYVYQIDPGSSMKEIKDETAVSVTRKIDTIINSDYLINNNINLNEYFNYIEKSTRNINLDSITNSVILDYNELFKQNKQKDNLRLNNQKGSFILLGNEINNNQLTGNINREVFSNLNDPNEIKANDKLNILYDLSMNKNINHVRLFYDSDISIELISKYNEIFKLNRHYTLMKFTKDKFSYDLLDDKNDYQFKKYVEEIIKNLSKLLIEFENPNYFYFVYKELVDYYQYYLRMHQTKSLKNHQEVFKLMFESIKVA